MEELKSLCIIFGLNTIILGDYISLMKNYRVDYFKNFDDSICT
jgi:hypothetical protein